MKAAAFDYVRARSVADVCERLDRDPAAQIVAGGQTLVPMMAMRLARPTTLIDISRIDALSGIASEGGSVRIGATTRQCDVERSEVVARDLPLMAEAIRHVGHPPTRARGTVGGSIANADPSAEIPLVATILDAEIHVATATGTDVLQPGDFFLGPMLTTLPEGGCLTHVAFPVWQETRLGAAFDEISARRSDYAYVSAGAQVALTEDGTAARIALGVGGAGEVPLAIDLSRLTGGALDEAAAAEAIDDALSELDPLEDLHASAAYRLRVSRTLALRVLRRAWAMAEAKDRRR